MFWSLVSVDSTASLWYCETTALHFATIMQQHPLFDECKWKSDTFKFYSDTQQDSINTPTSSPHKHTHTHWMSFLAATFLCLTIFRALEAHTHTLTVCTDFTIKLMSEHPHTLSLFFSSLALTHTQIQYTHTHTHCVSSQCFHQTRHCDPLEVAVAYLLYTFAVS